MTDETKAVEDFLGDLKDNGEQDAFTPKNDDPFPSLEQEKRGDQPEAGETEVVEERIEKPLPFHRDPKVQRYIEKEISKRIPEQKVEQTAQDNYFDDVISSFTAIVGNDTPEKVSALSALKNSLSSLDQRAAQKAFERLDFVRQEEVAQEKEYEDRLHDGFETIEGETGIDLYAPENKKLRIQFIDFVEKVAPKENGEISELPDLGETFKAFQSMRKPQSQAPRAKELASRSMERSGGEVSQQKTPERLTWDNIGEKIAEGFGM